MPTSNHVSFLTVFLPGTLLILSVLAAPILARGPASPLCDKAAPGPEQDECNDLVNNARLWEDGMRNIINAALRTAEPLKPMVKDIEGTLPQSLTPVSKDSLGKTCRESLGSLLDGFNQALGELNKDPYTLNDDITAAASSLSDCTDGLHEFGASSPVIQKGQVDMLKYANIALSVSSNRH